MARLLILLVSLCALGGWAGCGGTGRQSQDLPSNCTDTTALKEYVALLDSLAEKHFWDGDYRLTEIYTTLALQLIKVEYRWDNMKAGLYSWLALSFTERQMSAQAISYLDFCIGINRANNKTDNLALNYYNCAINRWRMGDNEGALSEVNTALALMDDIGFRILKSEILQYMARFEEAYSILKSINTRDKYYSDFEEYHHTALATCLTKMGRYAEALSNIQQSLRIDIEEFEPSTDLTNPDVKQLKSKPLSFVLLGHKVAALRGLVAQRPDDAKVLASAEEACRLLEQAFADPISYFSDLLDNLVVINNQHLVGGAVIDFHLDQYERTKGSTNLEKALHVIEMNHSALLKQEKGMVAKTAVYQSQWDSLKYYHQMIAGDKVALPKIRHRLDGLIKVIESLRFEAPVQPKTPNQRDFIADCKSYCRKNDAQIIIYQERNETVFGFGISGGHVKFTRIPKGELLGESIRKTIDCQTSIVDKGGEKASFEVYDMLVSPLLDPSGSKRLVILPDGKLSAISFELLLTSEPGMARSPRLLQRFAVSYAPSLTHLLDEREEISVASAAAFAFTDMDIPCGGKFKGQYRGHLAAIPGSKCEVEALRSRVGDANVRVFLGDNASIENFAHHSKSADLLHIAMHASASLSDFYGNEIVFCKEGGITEPVNSEQLLKLPIHPKLTILSSCETGRGGFSPGEGVFSLARNFFQLGSEAVVMSVWENNDYSSPIIMGHFYDHLSQGLPLDIAMQQAKLKYLASQENANALHPSVWGSLVVMGRQKVSLPSPGGVSKWWWALSLCGGAMAAFATWRAGVFRGNQKCP